MRSRILVIFPPGGSVKGVKGSVKSYGDPCSRCRKRLTAKSAMKRRPPRQGLLSYCRECGRKAAAKARKANPEKVRENHRRYREKVRRQVLDAYGNKCACCDESEPEFLALDHVNGGGNKHRRDARLSSPTQLRRHVIEKGFPPEFRLLCHNCNCARAWYGQCPHERQEA